MYSHELAMFVRRDLGILARCAGSERWSSILSYNSSVCSASRCLSQTSREAVKRLMLRKTVALTLLSRRPDRSMELLKTQSFATPNTKSHS